jgi:hypothetical protein
MGSGSFGSGSQDMSNMNNGMVPAMVPAMYAMPQQEIVVQEAGAKLERGMSNMSSRKTRGFRTFSPRGILETRSSLDTYSAMGSFAYDMSMDAIPFQPMQTKEFIPHRIRPKAASVGARSVSPASQSSRSQSPDVRSASPSFARSQSFGRSLSPEGRSVSPERLISIPESKTKILLEEKLAKEEKKSSIRDSGLQVQENAPAPEVYVLPSPIIGPQFGSPELVANSEMLFGSEIISVTGSPQFTLVSSPVHTSQLAMPTGDVVASPILSPTSGGTFKVLVPDYNMQLGEE